MKNLARVIPAVAVVLAVAWLGSRAVPPRDAEGVARVQAFGKLPVVYQGRVKPFDTLARNSLIVLSDRQTWRDEQGRKRPAIEWLLDVMANAPAAGDHRVFRIHNHDLLSELGLERRKGYRYAFNEFADRMPLIEMQVSQASRLEAPQRDVYDVKLLEFWSKIVRYRVLSEGHAVPELGPDPHAGLTALANRLDLLERMSVPHTIPPETEDAQWKPMLRAVIEGALTQEPDPALQSQTRMLGAWAGGDAKAFNDALAAYQQHLASLPGERKVMGFEALFNHLTPFYLCAVLYLVAFTLGCLSWLGWSEPLRRTAFWLLVTTFVAHTLAITARVIISGYPPITNLYGTAVFIGWGCVLLGLLLEWVYKMGIGNLLSATVGFLTLLIAHFLAGDGDTLQMMQAVLDTKFWLATHVIIINFGYAATFLAGGLSVLYILRGVLTRSLDTDTDRVFGRMIYGVLCFALLLSFVGTVLGGLWADDSWGRFWGWDPKENGALMIVLWNALILHARFGGMVKTRGIAVLAVFGGIVTAWSWFGVNQLGVGLHSYGFTDSITFWLLVFVASQLLIMGIGLLPRRIWRSGRGAPPRIAA